MLHDDTTENFDASPLDQISILVVNEAIISVWGRTVMDAMNLEYHHYEELVPESAAMCFLVPENKVASFTALCAARLMPTTDERHIVQTVVMAALETEQIMFKDPDILVEAVIRNPRMRDSVLAFAEQLLTQNLQ